MNRHYNKWIYIGQRVVGDQPCSINPSKFLANLCTWQTFATNCQLNKCEKKE